MRITTWNVNSIRRRMDATLRWIEAKQPDVLCLQETKCTEDKFPWIGFLGLGYTASVVGQPGYNGVAILSRSPQTDVDREPLETDSTEARSIAATIEGIRVLNVYVPHGAEVGSEKYEAKLKWLESLGNTLAVSEPRIVCGDFNVAPDDRDVYDPLARHEKLICSTRERMGFTALVRDGTFIDALRAVTDEAGLYTWWSHRVGAVERNRGLRVDHHLVHRTLGEGIRSVDIDVEERTRAGSSDHAPVTLMLERGTV